MADTILARMAKRATAQREAHQADAMSRAIRHVANGHIEWRDRLGNSRHWQGGFTSVGGFPIDDIEVLIALWKLHGYGLLRIAGDRLVVRLTSRGERRLAEWERSSGAVVPG